ncbi:MAG: hypothetical protein IJT34_02520 [Butyrivibrio sp.]|nr:hypothetical protein [Butyrivibrio sp.]
MADYSSIVAASREYRALRPNTVKSAMSVGQETGFGKELTQLAAGYGRQSVATGRTMRMSSLSPLNARMAAADTQSVQSTRELTGHETFVIDEAAFDLMESLEEIDGIEDFDLEIALEDLGLDEAQVLKSGVLAKFIAEADDEESAEACLTEPGTMRKYEAALEKWKAARENLANALGVDESELDAIIDQYMKQEYDVAETPDLREESEAAADSFRSIDQFMAQLPTGRQDDFRAAMQDIFAEMMTKVAYTMEQYMTAEQA